jgi:L-iditol 2-dehydrogenase
VIRPRLQPSTDLMLLHSTDTPSASGRMRAAVLADVERIEIQEVPLPEPAANEVRVRIRAVGLCGTDLHIYAGHGNYHRDAAGRLVPLAESPQILGHEIAGEVEALGSAVRDLVVGHRVIVDQGRTCVAEGRSPRCEYCVTGDSHQCEHYREHGITGLPGGLAEFIVVPAANAVPLRSALGWEEAALAEPLGCIVHSCELLRAAPARYRLDSTDPAHRVRTILVCGTGPAGLLFIQYLRRVLRFDGEILASEPNPAKRALAERFGATGLDPFAGDLAEAIRERTAGHMAELLIESSGAGPVFAAIPRLVRKQATLLLYGHGHAGEELSVMNGVQFLEPTILTPAGASGGWDADLRPATYRRALQLIEEGTIDVASLITHRYRSLDAVPAAFSGDHERPDYLKGVVLL